MKIYHFHNGHGGGVLSVIRNILLFQQSDDIENHIIHTINKALMPEFKILGLKSAKTEQVFYYSAYWNFYYTCMQLAKTIHDEQAIIIANDWLELGMVSHLGLKNPVVLILHGDYDYYYHLAVKHAVNIDIFICIASNIEKKLKAIIPSRKDDIFYRRFPVREPVHKRIFSGIKKLLFVGRCEKAKGFDLLPLIEQELQHASCMVSWSIIGVGSAIEQVQWPPGSQVHFLGEVTNDEVLKILPEHDLILLPSLAEGMPVSIIEAMKAGVIPIVNDLPGGIQELVQNNVTGYKIEQNKPEVYAAVITDLFNNPGLAQQLGMNCMSRASAMFNPADNAFAFEMLFKQAEKQNKRKKKLKIYGSRLDEPWIPNILVSQIRKRTKIDNL